MNLDDAKALALDLMRKHLLPGYITSTFTFGFDPRAVRRFGQCHYGKRRISLSTKTTLINDEARVRNTILHEIAHANVGPGHDHDEVWRAEALRLGCDGERCVDTSKAELPVSPWMGQCPGCKKQFRRWRAPSGRPTSCGVCAPRRYDPQFQLQWSRTVIKDPEAYAAAVGLT